MLGIILAFEAAVENRAAQATQRSPKQPRGARSSIEQHRTYNRETADPVWAFPSTCGPFWGHLGLILGHLGAILGYF